MNGRSTLVVGERGHDIERESRGVFSSSPQDAFSHWDELRTWADAHQAASQGFDLSEAAGAPSPAPRQVLGIGLNYRSHAAELGMAIPDEPLVFTKLPSCITGPSGHIQLRGPAVDFEAELVIVIARACRSVAPERALEHIAGFTVGQDVSDRAIQTKGPIPQLSFAKSAPTYGPTGPWLVTVDELEPVAEREISCRVNGELVQRATLADLIFDAAEVVSVLSHAVDLWPGDLIFTGTPAGCGFTRQPPRYLSAGDRIITEISGIGRMEHLCVRSGPTSNTKD